MNIFCQLNRRYLIYLRYYGPKEASLALCLLVLCLENICFPIIITRRKIYDVNESLAV